MKRGWTSIWLIGIFSMGNILKKSDRRREVLVFNWIWGRIKDVELFYDSKIIVWCAGQSKCALD